MSKATTKQVNYLVSLVAQTGAEIQRADGTVTTDIADWARSLDSATASQYIGMLKKMTPARPARKSSRRRGAHQQYTNYATEDEYGYAGR